MIEPTRPLRASAELQRRIVEVLRADDLLGTMLFPDSSPQLDPNDARVYGADVELPESVAYRNALPRILIETISVGWDTEQPENSPLDGDVTVYVHALAGRQDEELVELIDARVATVLLSTPLSSARIIASGLSYTAQRRKARVTVLDNAWEIVTTYRAPYVGVVA